MDDGRTILCRSANLVFFLLMPAHLNLRLHKAAFEKTAPAHPTFLYSLNFYHFTENANGR